LKIRVNLKNIHIKRREFLNMNKKELISQVASKTEQTKKLSEQMVDAMLQTMKETLAKGEDVKLVGEFSFEVKEVPEHTGRNPAKNEEIMIPASKKIRCKISKTWKDAVNGVE
jgi:DNA-binding protein HU-beta